MFKRKHIFIGVITILLIISFLSLVKTFNLQKQIGKDYKETIDYLQLQTNAVRGFLNRDERVNEKWLFFISNRLLVCERISEQIPMDKEYFPFIYIGLRRYIKGLMDLWQNDYSEEEEQWLEEKAIEVCDKLNWAFELIKNNAEGYRTDYGYYRELETFDSKTHKVLDIKLTKYLIDVLRIDINRIHKDFSDD